MSDNVSVLIAGGGAIGREYARICLDLEYEPIVVTRSVATAEELRETVPSVDVVAGGLEAYLNGTESPDAAILATPVPTLEPLCRLLIEAGVDRILAEKPLCTESGSAKALLRTAERENASVFVAFNRRHYASVELAREVIEDAGGVSSIHFDFTEATFRVDPESYDSRTLDRWGICNSSHVIDLAFHLCGPPERLDAERSGSALGWHPAGSIFWGEGTTTDSVPFTYHANWGTPGRWRVEINTTEGKLLFAPLERLRIQEAGTFEVAMYGGDYSLDEAYKPGFFEQTKCFLQGADDRFLDLADLPAEIAVMEEMFGYERDD